MSNIQSLNKDLYDKYDNRYIKRSEYSGGSAETTTYDNTTSGLTSTNVQGAIDEISETTTNLPTAGTQITGVLNAGETEITFTNDAITSDSTLNAVYTSKYGMSVNSAVFGEGSLTLTFSAQEENIDILVVIDASLSYGGNGADGADGTNGKSAYEYAVEGGYTGTETEFAQLFNNMGAGGNEWTLLGEKQGKQAINLPSEFNEILLITYSPNTNTSVVQGIITKKFIECITNNEAGIVQYFNAYGNNKLEYKYSITSSSIYLYYAGNVITETAGIRTIYYYR